MGVDANIILPTNVRLRDVAKVIGALCGNAVSKQDLGHDGSYAADVAGIKTEAALPEMAQIFIDIEGKYAQQVRSGEIKAHVSYHFEPDCGKGRLLMPRSTAFWLAIGKALVDFFGGALVYADCNGDKPNYKKRWKPNIINCPTAGKPWHDLQDRILALKPLTAEDFKAMKEFAAY